MQQTQISHNPFISSSPFLYVASSLVSPCHFYNTNVMKKASVCCSVGLRFFGCLPPRYFLRHQPMRIEECTVLSGSTEVERALCTPLPVCRCARANCASLLPVLSTVVRVHVHVRNVKCFVRSKSCCQLGENHSVAVPTDCWLSAEGPHRCVRQPGQFVLLCATPSVRAIDCG